jgi:hypothetical protein
VSESANSNKRSLECMRLAADCRHLANQVRSPVLQQHFLQMASVWSAHAVQDPVAHKSIN